ncbi:MAG: hypothetical protein ABL861_10935 [Nitrosomonas sp.]
MVPVVFYGKSAVILYRIVYGQPGKPEGQQVASNMLGQLPRKISVHDSQESLSLVNFMMWD